MTAEQLTAAEGRTRLVVVGQGYVGLPLALAAAEAGFSVVGVDVDPARVEELKATGRRWREPWPAVSTALTSAWTRWRRPT
jgi:UDP-N-acetyl-D-mannosaminuronate dehydrogenase